MEHYLYILKLMIFKRVSFFCQIYLFFLNINKFSKEKRIFFFSYRMVLFRCLSLYQQIRFLHRSTFLLARGIRRSDDPPLPSFTNLDKNISMNEDSNQMSVQEQFARLELQRLEQESGKVGNESNSFIEENNANQQEFENENDEQNLSQTFIDPSTTSIILFPGQGTQFVGMG